MDNVYKFIFPSVSVVFDLESEKIFLDGDDGKKEFFMPANSYNFYVIGGFGLLGRTPPGKAKFKMGKPGEAQVIEFRAITGSAKGGKEEHKEEERKKKLKEGAVLTFIDEKDSYKKSIILNKANLYALMEVFRTQDKVIPVGDGDVVFEKREGYTLVQGELVPFQKARALYYLLDNYIRDGSIPPVHQEWNGMKIVISPFGKRKFLEVFKKKGENFIPAGKVRLNFENALRIMSAL